VLNIRLSSWSPAFTAAAAWREVEVDRDRGEGLWPAEWKSESMPNLKSSGWQEEQAVPRNAVPSPELDIVRAIVAEPDIDLEGGREFKSGAMTLLYGIGQASSEDADDKD